MLIDDHAIQNFGPGSHNELMIKCDECGSIFNRQVRVYCKGKNFRQEFKEGTRRREPISNKEVEALNAIPDYCSPCTIKKTLHNEETQKKSALGNTGKSKNKLSYEEHVERAASINCSPLLTKEEWDKLLPGKDGFRVRCNICGHEKKMDKLSRHANIEGPSRCKECFQKAEVERKREGLPDRKYYYSVVDAYTRESWVKHFYFINPNNIKRCNKNPLDHKVSKRYGFEHNIPAYIIGSAVNLFMGLSKEENSQKHSSNSITEEELFDLYTEFVE